MKKRVFTNLTQGPMWKEISSKYPSRIVFPVSSSTDDYECDNVMGSHAGGPEKMCATYLSFPFLPPEFQRKLGNMLLFLIFCSLDRKIFGNKVIFQRVIDKINFLERQELP